MPPQAEVGGVDLTVRPPKQQQKFPGLESKMEPAPVNDADSLKKYYKAAGKLEGKKALITGADSGIGRAVAMVFAYEGADVGISYLPEEQKDAEAAKAEIAKFGKAAQLLPTDIRKPENCKKLVDDFVKKSGGIDILVNNAAYQCAYQKIEDLPEENIIKTFETNIFSMFFITKYAVPHMKRGATIVNTCSVVAFAGMPTLLDYSSSKGAIVTFSRSLSQQLIPRGIRVNTVAPGPVYTPFIPTGMEPEQVENFGSGVPHQRPAQPIELAPAYVYLASTDSSHVSGQTIHVNGGAVVGA